MQRPQQVVHGPIELLTLSISLWVIGGRPRLLDSAGLTQQLDQPGFKVMALVTVDALWNPIPPEPFCDQDFGHSGCLLVACGDSHGVLGEDICHHQDVVTMVAGRLQLGEVDGEDFQGATGQQWSGRGVQRGRKAAHGTAFAVANIVFDLVKHPQPVDPEVDESQGPLVALVTHVVMQSRKDLRLQSAWQHQLFNGAMLRVCHLPVETPISLHQAWELLDEGPETLVLDDRRFVWPGGDDWLNDGVLFLQLPQVSWGQVRKNRTPCPVPCSFGACSGDVWPFAVSSQSLSFAEDSSVVTLIHGAF